MKSLLKPVVLSTALVLSPVGPLATIVNAQSAVVTPIPLPTIGTVPTATSSEQESHDEDTIRQLMYVVELSRVIGGGISQLFASSQSMTSLLGFIRDTTNAQLAAMTGAKTIPLANGPDEVTARDGGTTIREMAIEGLGGAVANPTDIATTFAKLKDTYSLDKALEYQNEDTLSQVTVAHMASYGAVGAASAERGYKRANASMGRIDGYITALGASPDIKTSIDINTRVNIEVAQQLNEMLRSQSTLTTMVSMYYVVTAGVRADMEDNFDLLRILQNN
ncbi:type IV secretion system protein [Shinella kummerowiae]|jgi:hypothetical protein|uniref:type IV secretion system protein n=1 Tax=Shinella kummerowiae TaxID=417745 RepID=UPI0021B6373F|nr:type IV secretion system protein [Shinella kummerowiae]MCT7667476.1 type IV secretion system protein [Shinella kummerowiae]